MTTTTSSSKQKRLGAFYTPVPMAHFIVGWAVRSPDETIMDPGCGEAIFMLEAYRRLLALGASPAQAISQIHGVEIDQLAYEKASRLSRSKFRIFSISWGNSVWGRLSSLSKRQTGKSAPQY